MQAVLAHLSRMTVACVLPLAVSMMAPAAFAQSVGTYAGYNNEGDEVQVVVTQQNGALTITGLSDGGRVYCMGQPMAPYAYQVGLSQPIVNRKAVIDVLATNLYYTSTLQFSGDTVRGTIEFAVPLFHGTKEPPKTACAAKTRKQTFKAILGGAALKAPPSGTAYAVPLAALER